MGIAENAVVTTNMRLNEENKALRAEVDRLKGEVGDERQARMEFERLHRDAILTIDALKRFVEETDADVPRLRAGDKFQRQAAVAWGIVSGHIRAIICPPAPTEKR